MMVIKSTVPVGYTAKIRQALSAEEPFSTRAWKQKLMLTRLMPNSLAKLRWLSSGLCCKRRNILNWISC